MTEGILSLLPPLVAIVLAVAILYVRRVRGNLRFKE